MSVTWNGHKAPDLDSAYRWERDGRELLDRHERRVSAGYALLAGLGMAACYIAYRVGRCMGAW